MRVCGGLGNQMFQIAACFAAAQTTGRRTLISRSKIADGRPLYWDSALRNFSYFLTDTFPANMRIWSQPGNGAQTYAPIPTTGSLRIEGYFQSPKYFVSPTIVASLRALFAPSEETLANMRAKYSTLLYKRNVVVVHSRQGDYKKSDHHVAYHNPMKPEDHLRALALLDVKDPLYLFVCEEPAYWMPVIAALGLRDDAYCVLDEPDEVLTLALLQQFKTFVISNSTFAWWAAWLAGEDARVYAPRAWFGPRGPKGWEDIYMPSWTLF